MTFKPRFSVALPAALVLVAASTLPGCTPKAPAPTQTTEAKPAASAGAEAPPRPANTPHFKSVLGAGEVSMGAPPAEVAAALTTLKTSLKGRLMAAMKRGGPVAALGACQADAPTLTAAAQSQGVRVGRTSHRLRNPSNAPPSWAAELVQEAAKRRRDKVPARMTVDRGAGKRGYLEMIGMAGACVPCHGPAADLDPKVTAALATRYPDDAATGFQPGDVRGWFWAEYSTGAR